MQAIRGQWCARVLGAVVALASATGASAACPPAGHDRAALVALEKAGFALADDAKRQALALGLLDCLGNPDPVLRDTIAFEGLSRWMREDKLDLATRRAIYTALLPRLKERDAGGYAAPFAALVLSDVARTDRVKAWMEPAERAALVAAGAEFLSAVRDYRGFDAKEGWRHGVAHGADVALQLSLNPALDRAQLDRLLAAIASQVAPSAHFYVYGEGERLAAPVLYIGKRNLHTADDWKKWIAALVDPKPLASWNEAFKSQVGLAKRHDTNAFLLSLYVNLREGGDPALAERMLPAVLEGLKSVP